MLNPAQSLRLLPSKTVLLIAAFVATAMTLSLSDRMPAVWAGVIGLFIRLGRIVERGFAIDLLDRKDVPWQADEIGHVLLWGTGMVVIGFWARRAFRADAVAVALFLASVGIEILQGFASQQRTTSFSDIVANSTGIMIGLCVVVMATFVRDRT